MPNGQTALERSLYVLAMAAGGFSAALGGVVVFGWIVGSARLIQTHPSFPPMQYNTALGFLFCGAGMITALAGRSRLALAGGLLTAALGALSLLQYLFEVDAGIDRLLLHPFITTLTAHPGRIPPNSALCFLLAGTAILIFRRPARRPLRPLGLGILSTLLGALGLVAYFGYLVDMPQAHGWGRLTHMSVQDSVGFAILGGGFLAVAWRENQGIESGMPSWLPIPIGVGLATMTVCLWQALAAQARLHPLSILPVITLMAGLSMAFFFAWTLHLLRTARRRTREAEVANLGLADEVTGHRRTMVKLAHHASELERSLNTMRTETRIILSILNSMGDAVVVTDPEGKILLFNPEAERLIGLGATDAPQEEWPAIYGFYRPDAATPFPAEELPFAQALHGDHVDAVDLFIRNPAVPDGHWASAGGRPLRNARGELQGAVIVLRDVTAYKAAARMKDEFVSVVSHELRTPLTAIQGALGLLLGGAVGALPEKSRTMLDLARRNSERLMCLINDILDIQKIESGRVAFKREPLDLTRIVEQAIDVNADYAEAYHVSLTLDGRIPGARVTGDSDRLGQVMANFISNAVKFSPPQGRVEIGVARRDVMIRVSVADHGPGIPDAFRSRIFQKFAQADSSDTRQKGGTGLGLSICKAIIERLGGTIGYESEPGVKTVFYFELPERKEEIGTADDRR
jgi:signal transduction histidine kinase